MMNETVTNAQLIASMIKGLSIEDLISLSNIMQARLYHLKDEKEKALKQFMK